MKTNNISLRLILASLALTTFGVLSACGGGGTGTTTDNGTQFVSNGGSGSKISLYLEKGGKDIPTAGQVKFQVSAVDPQGNPLDNIRIFCETEHGIAIIEPTKGGVAFEHTSSSGIMSGVVGGLTPGSFLMECRGPQGFNLVARETFRVVGDIPEGFSGFPGAAGGNLGGGVFTDPLTEQVVLTQIEFITVGRDGSERSGFIDNNGIADCDVNTPGNQVEPFGPDQYSITVENNFDQRVSISSVEYVVDLRPVQVTSLLELGGLVVNGNSQVELTGVFTDIASEKLFVGTNIPVPSGTYNIEFTVRGSTVAGESFTQTQSATVVFGPFNYCNG